MALVRSGKCGGEAVNWGLGADNVLYIYGGGPMNDFSTNEGAMPLWAEAAGGFARRAEHHSGTGLRGCDQAGRIAFNNVGSAYYTGPHQHHPARQPAGEVGAALSLWSQGPFQHRGEAQPTPCLTVQDGILYNKGHDPAHPLPCRRRSDGLYRSGQRDRAGRRSLCILHPRWRASCSRRG